MLLSDQQVRALLDSAPDAMVIADEQGLIVFVNSQTELLFGYSRGELLGAPVEQLLPERMRPTHPSHRRVYTGAPRVRPMGIGLDLYARRRDGSEFPVEISLSPLQTEDGLLISSAIRDITERKLILEELKQARNEAEKANRGKSAFLATASHDLRQPLQTLILLNSVLQKTCTDPRAVTAVATQGEALASMSELVNVLLDISKLESGAIRPDIADCSLQAIFTHVKASFEAQAQAKGLRLVVEESDDVVRTDRSLLEQIIQNLVANAIRYTRAGTVRLRCRHDNDWTHIEVLDTGIGIPAQQKDAIFEEFFQLNRSTGDKREGLGLGLAIVRRIAQLLDYSIAVDSEPGHGSCFTVTVPRSSESSQLQSLQPATKPMQANGALIMLVDDEPSVAKATKMLLELEGHEVIAAASFQESLTLFKSAVRMPDLIVSDFHLSDENTGIEVIEQIRRDAGRSIPAILVTGDTSSRMVDAVERSGNCEVLSKPVAPKQFLERVNRLLQENRSSDFRSG